MRYKYRNIVAFLILFLFCVYYTYYFRPIVDDELYNFGFAKSILDGLVPYVHFNMIVPPLFHYVLSLFMLLFGKYLLVYHCVIAFLVVGITYIVFRKIGWKALGIYSLLLIYPYTGYNTFGLFLFMILLCMDSDNDIFNALLICGLFLTKQTLAILVIPSLLYSKKKKKVFIIYCIAVCLFCLYLFMNHSFYKFIDYCFLGMFNFVSGNSHLTPFFLIEIIIIALLLALIIKTKKKEYFYVLCFQIITLPVVNYVHFWIGFVPVMYLLLKHFKDEVFVNVFLICFCVVYFSIFSFAFIFGSQYKYLGKYTNDSFMKGRVTYLATSNCINGIEEQIEKYPGYKVYVLGNFSYLVKLNLDLSINHYDIINNGNMGYGGYMQYIKEIDSYCKENKCLFFISDEEAEGKFLNQVNTKILRYVVDNYYKKYSSNIFSVYSN